MNEPIFVKSLLIEKETGETQFVLGFPGGNTDKGEGATSTTTRLPTTITSTSVPTSTTTTPLPATTTTTILPTTTQPPTSTTIIPASTTSTTPIPPTTSAPGSTTTLVPVTVGPVAWDVVGEIWNPVIRGVIEW